MRPSYRGDCLVNLMASVEAAQATAGSRANPLYDELGLLPSERLRGRPKTVLFVIDGLGYRRLKALETGYGLKEHLHGHLRSVFPSTTASAVTSVFTGLGPLQHGLTGWHIWSSYAGKMITPLPYVDRDEGLPLEETPEQMFPAPALADRLDVPSHLVLPDYICDSVFSTKHGGRSERWPFEGLHAMFDQVLELLRQPGPAYIHAYWPDFDAISHARGTWSDKAEDHLIGIDAAFGEFLAACPSNEANILLTADHGFIDAHEDKKLAVGEHPDFEAMLERPLCGEPRVAYCYPKAGAEEDVCAYVDEQFSYAVKRHPAEQLLSKGYFGLGESHPQFRERIGEQVLVAREGCVIGHGFGTDDVIFKLTGFHGGISEDEMLIPLVFAQP